MIVQRNNSRSSNENSINMNTSPFFPCANGHRHRPKQKRFPLNHLMIIMLAFFFLHSFAAVVVVIVLVLIAFIDVFFVVCAIENLKSFESLRWTWRRIRVAILVCISHLTLPATYTYEHKSRRLMSFNFKPFSSMVSTTATTIVYAQLFGTNTVMNEPVLIVLCVVSAPKFLF